MDLQDEQIMAQISTVNTPSFNSGIPSFWETWLDITNGKLHLQTGFKLKIL